MASHQGHAEVVSVLLAAGAYVHKKGDKGLTLLSLAIFFVVALLLVGFFSSS